MFIPCTTLTIFQTAQQIFPINIPGDVSMYIEQIQEIRGTEYKDMNTLDMDIFSKIKIHRRKSPRWGVVRREKPKAWQCCSNKSSSGGGQSCWAGSGLCRVQAGLSTAPHCQNRSCALRCKGEPREGKSALPQHCDTAEKNLLREKCFSSQESILVNHSFSHRGKGRDLKFSSKQLVIKKKC